MLHVLLRTQAVGSFPLPTDVAVTASEREREKDGGVDQKIVAVSGTGGRADCSRASVNAPCLAVEAQHHLYVYSKGGEIDEM